MFKYNKPYFLRMKYIALVLLLALLLVAGCSQKVELTGSKFLPAEAPSGEPTELTGDMAALEEDAPAEDVEIDTAELENLDM